MVNGQWRQLWHLKLMQKVPQSARLSAGRGVQKLFGQCPNAFGMNLNGASLTPVTFFFEKNCFCYFKRKLFFFRWLDTLEHLTFLLLLFFCFEKYMLFLQRKFFQVARHTRTLDSSRPITAALDTDYLLDLAAPHLDIISLNKYFGW